MSKQKFFIGWKSIVLLGIVMFAVGVRIPIIAEPESLYERVMMVISFIGCMVNSMLCFRLAKLLYRIEKKRKN